MGFTKFINDHALVALLGKKFPMDLKLLAKSLDERLNYMCDEGHPLPMDLLIHNLSNKRKRYTSEFFKVDIDFVVNEIPEKNCLYLTMNDYQAEGNIGRPEEDQRVVLHLLVKNKADTLWAIHIPLQAVMTGFGDPLDGHQCYAHFITFLGDDGRPSEEPENIYFGITKRNWLTRMAEHFRKSAKGSRNKFHKLWRECQGNNHVLLNSELIALNQTETGAMQWEELMVDRCNADEASLNTIGGGFKGLEELGKFKLSDGEREGIAACPSFQVNFNNSESREGIGNAYMKKLWQDDQYYAKVIGNRSNSFSKEQVDKIRSLAKDGHDLAAIGKQIGVSNLKRLSYIINGKTYRRM
ncbi:hypothetical protein MTO98_15415 [Mucilaginibacter sp. SMC90]|uniref:hypothetical protein n=1 Tax=Mucilaginibacter sp. SMC90 TaxID=2929803 RepID=UPI001FB2D7D4|nr:hypothetical protein [Mucilaginibacter sp. SMC90]UOE52464.1 hypothetical protein MTO98_15415 [Mucilaginibacter sp. SMC90]